MFEPAASVGVPTRTSGADLTPNDLTRVTDDAYRHLRDLAHRYCHAVDATRSRKRANGSATLTTAGRGRYGTDDAGDDVAQDATLLYAKRLREITGRCAVSALWVATGEPAAWQYVRRDGETIIITPATLRYWAVRDAAASNGYRMDVKPEPVDQTPGEQHMRGLPHADPTATLAITPYLSGYSETIFRSAWGDGTEFPTLQRVLGCASRADDLGRAGVWQKTAHALYGGPHGSSSKVQRTHDAAVVEWRELSARLDQARDELVYRGARPDPAP